MRLEVLSGLSAVEPAAWDALVGDGSPFLEWGWLASVEASGCVSAATGWLPQHLALLDGGQVLGVARTRAKRHRFMRSSLLGT